MNICISLINIFIIICIIPHFSLFLTFRTQLFISEIERLYRKSNIVIKISLESYISLIDIFIIIYTILYLSSFFTFRTQYIILNIKHTYTTCKLFTRTPIYNTIGKLEQGTWSLISYVFWLLKSILFLSCTKIGLDVEKYCSEGVLQNLYLYFLFT